jgi:hypothetical protein
MVQELAARQEIRLEQLIGERERAHVRERGREKRHPVRKIEGVNRVASGDLDVGDAPEFTRPTSQTPEVRQLMAIGRKHDHRHDVESRDEIPTAPVLSDQRQGSKQ